MLVAAGRGEVTDHLAGRIEAETGAARRADHGHAVARVGVRLQYGRARRQHEQVGEKRRWKRRWNMIHSPGVRYAIGR
jgi:hypothetical protein